MKITRSLLEMILAAARDSYPYEFVALLTGKKGVINELIFLPSESGEMSAVIYTDMLPLGMKIYGTVHSHPSRNIEPSAEDLHLFSKYGRVHIIVGYPYDEKSWRCYDSRGNRIEIEVIDE